MATKAEQQAEAKGRKAARNHETVLSNPYHCANDRAAKTWRAWRNGFNDETKKLGEQVR